MQQIIRTVAVCVGVVLAGSLGWASDPVGVYAIVDKVVLEPSDDNPERAQIWGVFSLATGPGLGDTYHPPQRGYMYYSKDPNNPKASVIEWNDLKSLAGRDECVAFASRHLPIGTVRQGCETPAGPDEYPVAQGLTKFRSDTEYQPIADLLSLAAPRRPVDGGTAEAGPVKLTVRNLLAAGHEGATYHFALISRYGETREKAAVPAGEESTSWAPETPVEAGYEHRWSVQAAHGDWKGQIMTACFTTPFLRGDANGDREVDISDAVYDLIYLFSGGPAPRPLAAGDFDSNGVIELTDGVYLLLHLFQGGPAPPPPYPQPGLIPPSGP